MRLVIAAALLFAGIGVAQETRLGSKIHDFAVQDLNGKRTTFSELKGQTTVLIFIANQCPVTNGYVERMNSLYAEFTRRRVHFIFINANASELGASIAAHAKDYALAFPVYKDDQNVVADYVGAHTTPEAFVVDGSGIVRYHGAIDDSLSPGRVRKQWLRSALEAVIAGKPVERAETKTLGCAIHRARPSL
jgi:alkyl hydroperoxide reductase subunit AhpC